MTHTNGHHRLKELPPAEVATSVPPPAWFQIGLCSLAIFAGPILLAVVIGLVYLAAVVAGQTYALFRHSAG